jgi:hypothetical protein
MLVLGSQRVQLLQLSAEVESVLYQPRVVVAQR